MNRSLRLVASRRRFAAALRSARVLGALVLALSALAACSKTSAPMPVGTNTNWLKYCAKDSECGEQDSCICNVCTRSCTSASQCEGLSETVSCERLPDAVCGDEPASKPVCVQDCDSDNDCSEIEDGACVQGVCVNEMSAAITTSEPDAGPEGGGGMGGTLGTSGMIASAGNAGGFGDWPRVVSRIDGDPTVQIGAGFAECTRDIDCMLVGTSCNGCCGMGAIAADLENEYNEDFAEACRDYRGGICDCQPPDVVARCVDDFCAAVPRVDVADCFSPTQNAVHAYDPGAVGCACEQGDPDVCVNPAALTCALTGGGWSAWEAVDQGACGMRDASCQNGSTFTTAEACVDSGADCYRLPSGAFCGMGCITKLDCGAEGCAAAAYQPFTDDECTAYEGVPVTEGTCGAIRWRYIEGGFVNSLYYWNAETGELVAMQVASDMPVIECTNMTAVTYAGDTNVIRQCVIEGGAPACGQ